MKYLFLGYPKCNTCTKAIKWLEDHSIDFICRNIVENPPSEKELRSWIKHSSYTAKNFFNTSGLVYKELHLKDKMDSLSEAEKLKLLSSNGKLVKRPLLIGENIVLIGFKAPEWEKVK